MAEATPLPEPELPADFPVLEFERPIWELEKRIKELKRIPDVALGGELEPLETKLQKLKGEIYGRLTPWQVVEVARHPRRPQFSEYVSGMCDEYIELHGDRLFGDDPAISTGFARVGNRRFLLVGQRKGRDVKEKLACNFGCAHPEGYRKALAKMRLAERFGLPIVTMINTPGAYPGVGAEERGQAWAIAENIMEMSRLNVPIICIVIGEGGSGGALGIGVGDRVLMLQYSYYSVISPEGCASILWRDGSRNKDAAENLRLTSGDLKELGVLDEIVEEPLAGAHRNPPEMVRRLGEVLERHLDELMAMDPAERMTRRYERLRGLGNGVAPLGEAAPGAGKPAGVQAPAEPEPKTKAKSSGAKGRGSKSKSRSSKTSGGSSSKRRSAKKDTTSKARSKS